MVITETMAETYFSGQDPIGKSISVRDVEPKVIELAGGGSGVRMISLELTQPSPETKQEESDILPTQELTVTGVIRDIPRNSTLRFDFLFAFNPAVQKREWDTVNTYVLLPEDLSPLEMERRLDDLSIPWHGSRRPEKLKLQRLRDIHFNSGDIGPG